jgi:hypothetical protein
LKHLGGASKESRKALRGANRRATGRRRARTGPAVILFAKRCNGSRRPKGRSEPSVDVSCKPLDARSSLGGWSPGCRLNPWKARGVSTPMGAKHARREARSRLRGQRRRLETDDLHRGVTSRARGIASSLALPADGRRELAAALSPPGGSMPHEGSVSRLRGRKTLAPLLGLRPRERRPRDERS